MPGRSQQTQPEDSSLPQYDLKPIVKNGDDKVHIYLCAKPFQEEMGISFKKGGQLPGATSKVKQDLSDGGPRSRTGEGLGQAFARDDKIKPVWHWRTSK